MRSMTGFGRGESASEKVRVVVELQSVNRRFFDLNLQIPQEMSALEQELRGWIHCELARGSVTLRVAVDYLDLAACPLHPNLPLVKGMQRAWEEMATACGIPFEPQAFWQMVGQHPEVLTCDRLPFGEKEVLHAAVEQAVKALVKMREREGQHLCRDLSERLAKLGEQLSRVESLLPAALGEWRGRLEKKVKELEGVLPEMMERVSQEIVTYLDRGDITEEITRCRSHFDQFGRCLEKTEENVGKQLDFLLQEIFREVNTIGSKAQDATLSSFVVAMKSEIEKMREQIQNIE
ncbi:MAG: YicC family protein [Chlamydiia bacterium]|nr:YicC family protein [Chlamydiia bacterium]